MSRRILINEPGAGEWIMAQVGGRFSPERDHAISNHDGSEILGGFVLASYLGASIAVHMGGKAPGWCSRDLLWMVFHYAFVQAGVHKVLAPVPSDNHTALSQDLRAGFTVEATIEDALSPGVHLVVLSMTRERCRWLRIKPKAYRPGSASNG